jgi:chorismate mutase
VPRKKPPKKATRAKSVRHPKLLTKPSSDPVQGRREMTMVERVQLAMRIAAARGKPKPDAWTVIARREGKPMRTCQYVYAKLVEQRTPMDDPTGMSVLVETLDLYNEIIEFLAEAVRDADMWTARIGAARSIMDALKDRVELMIVMGRMPRSVAAASDRQRVHTMLRQMGEVLERHGVAPEVIEDLIAIIDEDKQPGLAMPEVQRALPASR